MSAGRPTTSGQVACCRAALKHIEIALALLIAGAPGAIQTAARVSSARASAEKTLRTFESRQPGFKP